MDAVEYDALRTKDLEGLGYRVLRIWNSDWELLQIFIAIFLFNLVYGIYYSRE